MALSIASPTLTLHPTPLTPSTFTQFGTVIASPLPPSTTTLPTPTPPGSSLANQSTALKYPTITPLTSTYRLSPSGVPAQPSTSLYTCFPRPLRPSPTNPKAQIFDLKVLERHPYTTQTFIPLTHPAAGAAGKSKYIVIVAPTLPDSSPISSLTPYFPQANTQARGGLPDLNRVRAFTADGGLGVTYAVGTWHSPVVVVGKGRMDFVVSQWMSGRAEEDFQEVALVGEGVLQVVVEGGNWGGRGSKL